MIEGNRGVFGGQQSFRAETAGLCEARAYIRDLTRLLEMPDDAGLELLIAAGEAISNAYLYGSGGSTGGFIYLHWRFTDNVLSICVSDRGGRCDGICTSCLHALAPYRGNGNALMRAMTDGVEVHHDGGTQVTLTKRTPSAATAGDQAPTYEEAVCLVY